MNNSERDKSLSGGKSKSELRISRCGVGERLGVISLRQADPELDFRTATRPVVLWSEAQVRYWLGTRPGSGNWR